MKHEEKICPRCNSKFECKVGDIANCQCNIPLSMSTHKYISSKYKDCLCVNCLKEIDQTEKNNFEPYVEPALVEYHRDMRKLYLG